MRISQLLFLCLILCDIVAISVITFPQTSLKEKMRAGQRKIQWRYIVLNSVSSIIFLVLSQWQPKAEIITIDLKLALLLVPLISCFLFTLFLYYPLVRFLTKENIKDKEISDTLVKLLFECAFGEADNREKKLADLEEHCSKNRDNFVEQYGLDLYLGEYLKHADTASHKPSIDLTKCVLEQCNRVKCDIDNYLPAPFSNISLVFSFSLSTIITIFISVIEQFL